MDLQEQVSRSSFILNDESYEPLLNVFKSKQLITTDLLLSSTTATAKKLNRTSDELDSFIAKLEDETINAILQTKHSIPDVDACMTFSTGDEQLDKDLNGGIPIGYLIEIAGKSSSGKTNLLLQLAIAIQLPKEFGGLGLSIYGFNENSQSDEHLNKKIKTDYSVKTLYIPTESPLPTNRLNQVLDHFSAIIENNGISKDNYTLFPKLENVLTTAKVPTSLEEQEHILTYQVPVLLEKNPEIKLLILDSITHHLRVELNWNEQPRYTRNICKYLKELAQKYDVTVVIANQVTDKPIGGIYRGAKCEGENNGATKNLLWKLNSEYQLSWLEGWDEIGVIYRQLLKREGIVDSGGDGFEKLDYLDDDESDVKGYNKSSNKINSNDLKGVLKGERRRLFENSYKVKISGITTRPALGIPLLEFVDMRCVLSKAFKPVLNENLIDEFSMELGIDATIDDVNSQGVSQAPATQIVEQLSKNSYLKYDNFEWFRILQVPFGPLIKSGCGVTSEFEIWKGGIRHKNI